MPGQVGWQDRCTRGGRLAPTRREHLIGKSAKILLALAALLAGAIALHRFQPEYWPALADKVMHSLHGTGFAAMALIVYRLIKARFPTRTNYLLAGLVTFGIGVVSEAAQIPGPRDAQFSDLLVDGLGIFGALGLLAAFDHSIRKITSRPLQIALPLSASLALAIACAPSLWYSYALIQQHRVVPQLLTFEHAWERTTFGQTVDIKPSIIPAPDGWPVAGGFVAKARENGRWGIFISLHTIRDWRDYSAVSFVAAAPSGDFSMDIGVKDMAKNGEYHGVRFYKTVKVMPEPRRFTITFDEIRARPENRDFDFALVEAIVLSASRPGSNSDVLLDDFRLE